MSAPEFDEGWLPRYLLERVSRRGNEFAWPLDDIPLVIEAARQAGLGNIGGQLQFRFPSATCECPWVEVDVAGVVRSDLPWRDRVERSAALALARFGELRAKTDFLAEGRARFSAHFGEVERQGRAPEEFVRFVWYVDREPG